MLTLQFGSGCDGAALDRADGRSPHRCIGHDYAKMQIAAVISSAAWTMDWEHEVTDQSEEVACVAQWCDCTDRAQDGAHDLPVGRAAA